MVAVGMKLALVGIVFCLHVALLRANPDGAPESACQDMTPQHGVAPQANPSPYTAQISPAGSTTFSFRITANDVSRPFKGLFAQARDASNNIVGTFIGNEDMKVMDCSGGTLNAVTHTTNDNKTDVSVYWNGAGITLPVTMYYTTCEDNLNFWVMESRSIP